MKKLIIILAILLITTPVFCYDQEKEEQGRYYRQIEESLQRQEKQLRDMVKDQERQERQNRSRDRQREIYKTLIDSLND